MQHANSGIVLCRYVNCYPAGFRKRIRNHLKIFAIKANPAGRSISEVSHPGANLRHGGRFNIMAAHIKPL